MKNTDIHKAFGKANIRDFLAQKYQEAFVYFGDVQSIKREIEVLQEKLRLAEQREAIQALAEAEGWAFWEWDSDAEDLIEYENETYMPFLGTEEEYKILIDTLRSEEP